MGDGGACLEERLVLFQFEFEVQQDFLALEGIVGKDFIQPVKCDGGTLLGLNVQMIVRARSFHFSVHHDGIVQRNTCQRTEEVLIEDYQFTFLGILHGCPDVLVVVLNLVGMRIGHTVRIDDAVAVEVVVGGRETTEVATIRPDGLAGNLAGAAQTLVDEVPDVATLIVGQTANQIPILLEATA